MFTKTIRVFLFAALALLAACNQPSSAADTSHQISFSAKDGVEVFADLYLAKAGKTAPLIILFHQAFSNARGEYATIIPRLTELGYSVLAVDQRSGGGRFGSKNRTVKTLGKGTGYCEAYTDLETALDYAIKSGFSGPRMAWGSSYSAALVLKLAGERKDDLSAVLSFSPARGVIRSCNVSDYVDTTGIPILVMTPRSEMAGRVEQFARFKAAGQETYVAEKGVHGSSMLVEKRTKSDTSETWDTVIKFLKRHGAT